MAISTTYAHNPDLDAFIREGLERCGYLGPSDELEGSDRAKAVRIINTNLKSWQAADRLLRHKERYSISLTPGTAAYTLPADTLDVDDFGAVRSSASQTDYPLRLMERSEYLALSKKDQEGVPSRFMVEMGDTATLTLYAVPDSTVSTAYIVRHRIVRDFSSGTTPDIFQRYVRALMLQFAADWAESSNFSTNKVMRLAAQAEAARNAVTEDGQAGSLQFRLR